MAPETSSLCMWAWREAVVEAGNCWHISGGVLLLPCISISLSVHSTRAIGRLGSVPRVLCVVWCLPSASLHLERTSLSISVQLRRPQHARRLDCPTSSAHALSLSLYLLLLLLKKKKSCFPKARPTTRRVHICLASYLLTRTREGKVALVSLSCLHAAQSSISVRALVSVSVSVSSFRSISLSIAGVSLLVPT